jgi:hypothetical protein
MTSFTYPLPPIRPLEHDDGECYELAEPLAWIEADGTPGAVEAGYVTDLASVPRPVRTLAPSSGLHTPAAIRHDRRCDDLRYWHEEGRPEHLRPHLTSRQADLEFRDGIRQLDPRRPLRAYAMWAGVRLGALNPRSPWRRDGWRDLAADAPAVLAVLLLVAPLYVPVGVVNLAAQLLDGLAQRLACLAVRRRPAPVEAPAEPALAVAA